MYVTDRAFLRLVRLLERLAQGKKYNAYGTSVKSARQAVRRGHDALDLGRGNSPHIAYPDN